MTAALRCDSPPPSASDLRNAQGMTRPLMLEIIDKACRRFPSLGQTERTARLMRLIDAEAWADAALALLELELPLWHVRRIAYDEGEWHCALSRERELPDWLDAAVEGCHGDLAIRAAVGLRGSPGNGHRGIATERSHRAPRPRPVLRTGRLREFQLSQPVRFMPCRNLRTYRGP